MNAMIETSWPFGTDGATYGYETSQQRPPLAVQSHVRGRAVCVTVAHGHDTLESAGDCGEPIGRPAVAELAAAGAGPSARRVTSRAHKADLTETQLKGLRRAVDGLVLPPGQAMVGAGVSRATYRALANKGYGRTLTATETGLPGRRHEVIAFEINDLGRRALAELDAERGQ